MMAPREVQPREGGLRQVGSRTSQLRQGEQPASAGNSSAASSTATSHPSRHDGTAGSMQGSTSALLLPANQALKHKHASADGLRRHDAGACTDEPICRQEFLTGAVASAAPLTVVCKPEEAAFSIEHCTEAEMMAVEAQQLQAADACNAAPTSAPQGFATAVDVRACNLASNAAGPAEVDNCDLKRAPLTDAAAGHEDPASLQIILSSFEAGQSSNSSCCLPIGDQLLQHVPSATTHVTDTVSDAGRQAAVPTACRGSQAAAGARPRHVQNRARVQKPSEAQHEALVRVQRPTQSSHPAEHLPSAKPSAVRCLQLPTAMARHRSGAGIETSLNNLATRSGTASGAVCAPDKGLLTASRAGLLSKATSTPCAASLACSSAAHGVMAGGARPTTQHCGERAASSRFTAVPGAACNQARCHVDPRWAVRLAYSLVALERNLLHLYRT